MLFQGRPYGYGQPPEINYYDHKTVRFALGLEGRFSETAGWDIALVRGSNDALLNPRDVNAANFQAALQGFGGSGCTAGAAPLAGEGGCLFFNPFSSNFAASAGDELFNGPQLYDFIIGDYQGDGESRPDHRGGQRHRNAAGFPRWATPSARSTAIRGWTTATMPSPAGTAGRF